MFTYSTRFDDTIIQDICFCGNKYFHNNYSWDEQITHSATSTDVGLSWNQLNHQKIRNIK